MYAETHSEKPYHDGSPDRFTKPHLHWSKSRSAAFPFHAVDGVSIFLTNEEPERADYRWMGVATSVTEETDGDQH